MRAKTMHNKMFYTDFLYTDISFILIFILIFLYTDIYIYINQYKKRRCFRKCSMKRIRA